MKRLFTSCSVAVVLLLGTMVPAYAMHIVVVEDGTGVLLDGEKGPSSLPHDFAPLPVSVPLIEEFTAYYEDMYGDGGDSLPLPTGLFFQLPEQVTMGIVAVWDPGGSDPDDQGELSQMLIFDGGNSMWFITQALEEGDNPDTHQAAYDAWADLLAFLAEGGGGDLSSESLEGMGIHVVDEANDYFTYEPQAGWPGNQPGNVYQGCSGDDDDCPPLAVPEPSTMILLAGSLLGLAGYGWKRMKK